MLAMTLKCFFMKKKLQYSKGEVYHDNKVLNLNIIHILHSISLSVSLPRLKRRTKALKVCVSSTDCTYNVMLAEWLLDIYIYIYIYIYIEGLGVIMCSVCLTCVMFVNLNYLYLAGGLVKFRYTMTLYKCSCILFIVLADILTSNSIMNGVMSGVIFSTYQSATDLPNLEIFIPLPTKLQRDIVSLPSFRLSVLS